MLKSTCAQLTAFERVIQRGEGFNCPHNYNGLRRWDEVPGTTAWSVVNLPENTRILLSGCMINRNAIYSRIVIPESSELIIDDQPMFWRVGQIIVHGKLRIGSESCRTINPSTPKLV